MNAMHMTCVRMSHPKLGYMVRVRERMERVGFGSADPLCQLVRRAEDALHRLHVELHY